VTALSAAAREQIRESGLTIAGYTRHHFPDGHWGGDACGCPDDRCAGHHHDDSDDCGCLPVLIRELAALTGGQASEPHPAGIFPDGDPAWADHGGALAEYDDEDLDDDTEPYCTAAAMAAELTTLAGWIDAQLDNDRADRQYICETTELRLHEIAGLITRAAAAEPALALGEGQEAVLGQALGEGQEAVLGQALGDAIEYRTPGADCADCDVHPAGLCEDHAADLDKTDAYLELARALGIEVER